MENFRGIATIGTVVKVVKNPAQRRKKLYISNKRFNEIKQIKEKKGWKRNIFELRITFGDFD